MKKPKKTERNSIRSGDDVFEEFDYFGLGKPNESIEDIPIHKEENMVFKFVETASKSKLDLIKTADNPEEMEKKYNPFITNKAFSFHADTILHANEMNSKHWVYKDAQYRYYLGSLRPRFRKSEWFKQSKDNDLDNIQQYYQCNRTVAKQYLSVLSKENLDHINKKVSVGGT